MAVSFVPNSPVYNGGQVLTSSGTSATWTTTPTNFHDGNNEVMTIPSGGNKVIIEKKAALDVRGSLSLNGLDLEERLKTIERVLTIPERDVTLEAKHPRLKKLYEEYITALEEYRTWERLKGND